MEDSPFFSIVMPIYNVSTYIVDALKCVKNQTCTEWELILVDDCSPDDSIELATQFFKNSSKLIVLHHKENQGLSAARNTGMSAAKGKYIWFPDPDDTYKLTLLEDAKKALTNFNNPPLIMFGHEEKWYNTSGKLSHTKIISNKQTRLLNVDELRRDILLYEQNTQYGYAWNKLYDLSYLRRNNLSFKKIAYIEDIEFNINVFQNLDRLAILSGWHYSYAKRPNVSLTGKYNEDFYAIHVKRVQLLFDQLSSWGNNYLTEQTLSSLGFFLCRYIIASLRMNCFPDAHMSHKDRLNWCKNIYKNNFVASLIEKTELPSNLVMKICIIAIQNKNFKQLLLIGRITYAVEKHFYPLLSKLKS